ncbi:MAG: alpha/beta fold hydrolase [Desulfobulbus sp.]
MTKVDGCELHSLETGSDSGLPVLLLHGKNFQAETWRELGTLDMLAQMDVRVIALDLPGFGKSPESSVMPAEMVSHFCAERRLAPTVVVGPSMGGRVAMEFAIREPECIAGLVLIGAVGVEENRADLKRITAPTLILWGEQDQISPLANSDILLQELPQARREIYPEAPHPCYLTLPDRWHASLRDFVTGLLF